ncbi:glycoside hydrolase family 43 protein [Sphingopyxis granuli]|uniref:glycoside hydrolase family 43 protein n=1 Tax=Sphingopyxis granuli TaxID=267128 RepID=UPI001F538484|nr:glycoside hydrolase family 43 protein [Sphingopyxis granuli]UNK80101.1 glycoside hydrolase family 43 protein [Sphingopyxis granuli]
MDSENRGAKERRTCRPRLSAVGAALLMAFAAIGAPGIPDAAARDATFHNPLLDGGGQDPSILPWEGHYYLVQTRRGVMRVFKSPTLTGLRSAKGVEVWRSFKNGSDLNDLWAPEIVALDGKFYIYVAAARNGVHESRRMHVLEAESPTGPYRFKGKIADVSDRWAIDGSVVEHAGERYFVWSGWVGDVPDTGQNLYIARMSNPWTITGPRHLLSAPTAAWERIGREPINEGPQPLYRDGRLMIVFSASHSMTDDYCLGLLTYKGSGALTDRASWTKSDGCVFSKNVAGGVYGPGHNVLVPTIDGREIWNVYHAVSTPGCGWSCRTIRMQKVDWRPDGTPDFGRAKPLAEAIPVPSGDDR